MRIDIFQSGTHAYIERDSVVPMFYELEKDQKYTDVWYRRSYYEIPTFNEGNRNYMKLFSMLMRCVFCAFLFWAPLKTH